MSIGSQIKKNIQQILFSTSYVVPGGIGEYLPFTLYQGMELIQPLVPQRAGLLDIILSFESGQEFKEDNSVILDLKICETESEKIVFKERLQGEQIKRFERTRINLAPAILWPGKKYALHMRVVRVDEKSDLKIHTVQAEGMEMTSGSYHTGLALAMAQTYVRFNTAPLLAALFLLGASVWLLFFPSAGIDALFSSYAIIPVLLAPLLTLFIVELLNTLNEKFWLPARTFLLNYIVIFLFQVLLAGAFAYFRPAIFLTLLLFALLSLANHFKQYFRGDPLFAADFAAAGMAMKTRGHLVYEVQLRFLLAFFSLLVFIGLFSENEITPLEPWMRLSLIIGSLLANVILGYLILFNNKWVARNLGIGIRPWNPMNDYRQGGFVIPFYRSVRDLIIVSPRKSSRPSADLYSAPQAVENENREQPDIIVIMNESFCDFRNIRDFAVSETVMPFYDTLMNEDNVIRGKLLVPVFGGGTSNTEFEYLTGSSMFYFGEASVPYLNYFRRPVHGLPDLFKQQGYACQAIHPYMRSFYNRDSVYPHLGFDSFLTMEKFPANRLVDQFISDQADYEMILQQLQDKKNDQPGFIFSVTMQNHFPYLGKEENLSRLKYHIRLPDIVNSEGVEYFLSKLRESDDALKYLINELKKTKKPTLLVFFGDHLPGNNSSFNNFYGELFGKSLAELDFTQTQKLYETPYFIWANYKLPEIKAPLTSGNFLGLMTVDLARGHKSPYYDFLSEINSRIKAMGNKYIVAPEGTYEVDHIPDALSSRLNRYWVYQYDNIVRLKHKK